ncbi:MPN domain-containing protein [Meloidogyne graminicola]|uniref:COP9 signalosome complex subunit 5 n=1 Tax=Meloidogyne graminicola TaxID=189291 RepID=A0A8S9ZLA9_9BILA|nr:MPN domain-containing protein [Meloidogyne graminicola]
MKGQQSSSSAQIAQRTWMLENSITDMDTIFKYDKEEQQMIRNVKPWEKDPHYFKEVKVSSIALLKMVMHARSGGNIEVMGLMQGRVDSNTLIVIDSFALPVEGTETRVNAQAQAYEYMTNYSEGCEAVGRFEKEPFVAIVVDPIRTISAGKVDIGAFRTYPKGYKPPDEPQSEYQTIPLNKIEDFGVHCKQYYSLDITYFKSSLDAKIFDALWNTYWVNTLCSNNLITNSNYITSQIYDLAAKLEQIGNKNSSMFGEKLNKAVKDGEKLGCEVLHGMVIHAVKNSLFSSCSAPKLTIGNDEQMTEQSKGPLESDKIENISMENHRFLWSDKELTEAEKDWGAKLAKRYYDKLFKEYCIIDLTKYKQNVYAMRWRIEKELFSGKGQFECGNKYCKSKEELSSWEKSASEIWSSKTTVLEAEKTAEEEFDEFIDDLLL